jgi:ADP-ribosylation factor-like protein 1
LDSHLRPYWRCYYPNTNAIVFVIDSSDKDRIDIVKQELFIVLQEEELRGIPVAILANKQDIEGCMTDVEVICYFNIDIGTSRTY